MSAGHTLVTMGIHWPDEWKKKNSQSQSSVSAAKQEQKVTTQNVIIEIKVQTLPR